MENNDLSIIKDCNARITTLEKYTINKYIYKIRVETESKYPNQIDPCSKFPIEEEAFMRMQKDGLYDNNNKFIGNKEVILLQKNNNTPGIIRDIDNLKKEIEIFNFDETHNYYHGDINQNELRTQEELKNKYFDYKKNHMINDFEISEETKNVLINRIYEKIKNYVKSNSFGFFYLVEDKRNGAYTYALKDTVIKKNIIAKNNNYIVKEKKFDSKHLEEKIETILKKNISYYEHNIEKELKKAIDIGGPEYEKDVFSIPGRGNKKFSSGIDKKLYQSGEFDSDIHYVNSDNMLKKLVNEGKFDYIFSVPNKTINLIKREKTLALNNTISIYKKKIPYEQNLECILPEQINFNIDLNNIEYEEVEDIYEDEKCVSIAFDIKNINPNMEFLLKDNKVSVTITNYNTVNISSPSLPPFNMPKNVFQAFIKVRFEKEFEKETGKSLNDYIDYVYESFFEYDEGIPEVKDFIENEEERGIY